MIANLGINYEVALEVLGQSMQPFIRAIAEERAKPTPSAALIEYCETRKAALSRMQNHLSLDDLAAILDRDDLHAHLFR